jgi:small subunit ribosomal protein S16
MLAIKLRRQGKKHQASFRLVVAEKRSKLGGKFVDDLGWFDPHNKKFEVKKEKVGHWLKVGAQPTPSAHNLLVRAGAIDEPKVAVHSRKRKAPTPAESGEVGVPTSPEANVGKENPPVPAEVKKEVQEETKTE